MGGGEIIGNQSVYWSMDHGDSGRKLKVKQNESKRPSAKDEHEVATDTKAQGRDPKTVEWFDVRLRFESKAEAEKQLQAALEAVRGAAGNASFFVEFKVPATLNGKPRTNPEEGPRPDIGIKW
jgi:hypothetical protein